MVKVKFNFLKCIYLFWAVLGLHCCMGFFLVVASSAQASHYGDFSCCGAQNLGTQA